MNPEREETLDTETGCLIPLMLIDDKSRYITHENNDEERKAAANELGECLKSAMADCYANNTLTKEAYISNIQKYISGASHQLTFEPVMEVKLVDQYGRAWSEVASNQSMKSPLTGDRTLPETQASFLNPLDIGSRVFYEGRQPIPLEYIKDYYKKKMSGIENPSIDILALGKGPLSYEGAKEYIESDSMYLRMLENSSNSLSLPIEPDNEEKNTTNETIKDVKEYVSLKQMKKMGWNKIHIGYEVVGTNEESPMEDMTSEITGKLRNINQTDVDKINALLEKYHINTKQRIAAFFAECSAETGNGQGFLEKADNFDGVTNRNNLKKWFDNNKEYGFKYRGAGAIHLTWNYNYIAFKKWMKTEFGINDSNIIKKGAEYVAMNYPWEAAVFFWDANNLNNKADTGDIHQVTEVVNYNMTEQEYNDRVSLYRKWMNY